MQVVVEVHCLLVHLEDKEVVVHHLQVEGNLHHPVQMDLVEVEEEVTMEETEVQE
jgi:hypothetical protein